MVQLRVHPLTHGELVNALSSRNPVYREEEEAFLSMIPKIFYIYIYCINYLIPKITFQFLTAWFSKTPTCKKKQRITELELQRLEEANEKKKKGKKK